MDLYMYSQKILLRLAVGFLLLLPGSHGQINDGTIIGTVRDIGGAAVPGAQLQVTNVATNVSSSTTTNNVGEYLVTNLVPGRYTVSCEMQGFRKEIFTDLTIRAGTSSRVDFSLQPGDV